MPLSSTTPPFTYIDPQSKPSCMQSIRARLPSCAQLGLFFQLIQVVGTIYVIKLIKQNCDEALLDF